MLLTRVAFRRAFINYLAALTNDANMLSFFPHESGGRVELDDATVAERHDVIRIHDRSYPMLGKHNNYDSQDLNIQAAFSTKFTGDKSSNMADPENMMCLKKNSTTGFTKSQKKE